MYSDAFDFNFGQKCCYNRIMVQLVPTNTSTKGEII